jgi:hypothetical protein
MDSATQTARVGQERLAADLGGMTPRNVQKLTVPLRRFGLQVKTGKGPEQANVYRIGSPPDGENTNCSSPIGEENTNCSSPIEPENTNCSSGIKTEYANWSDINTRTGVTENANYSSPLLNKSLQEESPMKDSLPDDDARFEEWWQHYPKKVAKGGARKAYLQIIRKGVTTEAELLAGAMRYAAERTDEDDKWTKHPATWLSNECWKDAPAASTPRKRSHLDNIRAGQDMVPDDDSDNAGVLS